MLHAIAQSAISGELEELASNQSAASLGVSFWTGVYTVFLIMLTMGYLSLCLVKLAADHNQYSEKNDERIDFRKMQRHRCQSI
jgi:hypothetical protein